jgi:PhnB protein
MSIKNVNPYLNFNGTAAKAIELYEKVFGVKAENRSTFGEIPGGDVPPEHAGRIMHARLHIGAGLIMISDTQPGHTVATESNVQVLLDFGDEADMRKKFEALAAGGKVTMALQDTFWGAAFGMLTDAYGIHWMFNCEKKN